MSTGNAYNASTEPRTCHFHAMRPHHPARCQHPPHAHTCREVRSRRVGGLGDGAGLLRHTRRRPLRAAAPPPPMCLCRSLALSCRRLAMRDAMSTPVPTAARLLLPAASSPGPCTGVSQVSGVEGGEPTVGGGPAAPPEPLTGGEPPLAGDPPAAPGRRAWLRARGGGLCSRGGGGGAAAAGARAAAAGARGPGGGVPALLMPAAAGAPTLRWHTSAACRRPTCRPACCSRLWLLTSPPTAALSAAVIRAETRRETCA